MVCDAEFTVIVLINSVLLCVVGLGCCLIEFAVWVTGCCFVIALLVLMLCCSFVC